MVPQGNLIPNYTSHQQPMQNKNRPEHISFTETLVNTWENLEKVPGGSPFSTEPAFGYPNKVCPSFEFFL